MQLDYSTVKNAALWVLIAIVVVGLVLAILIKKVVGKVITLVLVAVIVFVGWQQRAKIISYGNDLKAGACSAHPRFFGIDVTFPGC